MFFWNISKTHHSAKEAEIYIYISFGNWDEKIVSVVFSQHSKIIKVVQCRKLIFQCHFVLMIYRILLGKTKKL